VAVTASCPSCGAPVVFQSAASIFAVCEYCQSTLVRHDQALEDIGKMAALVEDRSPLQIGAEGSYGGVHFALIGRIQIKYSQGIWNEWYLMFDDMRTGWLSEAGGEYVVSFIEHVQEVLPAFVDLKISQRFVMASRPWTVTNIENAECIAGQGELPFKVGAGYPLPTVDLRSNAKTGPTFATLDYSETPPLLFLGEPVVFDALKMNNLRSGMAIPSASVQAQVFRCPSCGSPMSARSKEIIAVGCASCGAVVDTADASHKLLSKALSLRDEQAKPRIPLGSKGELEGKPVEVIGFLVKQTTIEGISYNWREYLLAGDNATYRWLTEYNGHWNTADVLSHPPASSGAMELADVQFSGQKFKHFSSTPSAKVIQVAGEFTWRVRVGESNQVVDYVAPPLMLSRESTDNELSWSLGNYVEPEIIRAAFKLSAALPEPLGVYANQPNPWEATHKRVCGNFWKFGLVATLLQLIFVFILGGTSLLRQTVEFSQNMAEDSLTTKEFEIRGKPRKITVRNTTSLDNNWIGLEIMLVNKASGQAWPAAREIAYYYGRDGGESWSEGNREDEVVFLNIPAGTYYLTVDPDLAPENSTPVRDTIEVFSGGSGWSNYVMVMIFLIIFPIFTRLRLAAFEAKRWSESDHAPVSSSDSDSDSDD
jgi:ribosomal protein L37AE/L43A